MRLYVYYRIDAGALAAVREAVMAMQAALRSEQPTLEAALLRRPEAKDGEITLMETYAAPGGIDAALQARIEGSAAAAFAALAGCLRSPRHVERFEPLA
ncbi:DUF4936 family protein [Aquabacterium humicola]|uniref:DUF4936 family protein n=1 Tax=Aquabacterium humicola TaxID=3237377 RepID=UPI0025432C64|nr:DUF4936 family protein [Rubrivivax pictus]